MNEITQKKSLQVSLSMLAYSIGLIGFSLFFVALNYTTNLPIFANLRASPLFLISIFILFWWIRFLSNLTKITIVPLVVTEFLALASNFFLHHIFLQDSQTLGFTSNIFYYLSIALAMMSILATVVFVVRIWLLRAPN